MTLLFLLTGYDYDPPPYSGGWATRREEPDEEPDEEEDLLLVFQVNTDELVVL